MYFGSDTNSTFESSPNSATIDFVFIFNLLLFKGVNLCSLCSLPDRQKAKKKALDLFLKYLVSAFKCQCYEIGSQVPGFGAKIAPGAFLVESFRVRAPLAKM